jgi:hypothetical protein
MKTLTILFLMMFSAVSYAGNRYDIQTLDRSYKYDRDNNQLSIGESQVVTVTDDKGNQSTFKRGVGKMIDLNQYQPQMNSQRGCAPKVYHRGKLIEGGCR